jgi:hypothetical protein
MTIGRILVALSLVASVGCDYWGSLGSVSMPSTAQVGGKTLVLNGVGLRAESIVRVYAAALYLETKSTDADAIIRSNAPKRVVMRFIRSVSRDQLVDAFTESFAKNSLADPDRVQPDIARLLASLEPVNAQDEMTFTFVPGVGTTVATNGRVKLSVSNDAFASALFSVWLGPHPPTADVKNGMLGQ